MDKLICLVIDGLYVAKCIYMLALCGECTWAGFSKNPSFHGLFLPPVTLSHQVAINCEWSSSVMLHSISVEFRCAG